MVKLQYGCLFLNEHPAIKRCIAFLWECLVVLAISIAPEIFSLIVSETPKFLVIDFMTNSLLTMGHEFCQERYVIIIFMVMIEYFWQN